MTMRRRECLTLSGVALATAGLGGRLTLLGTVSCGGRGPREMGIEPSGRYLYECNQQSGDVTTFAIDPDTGRLTERSKVELPLAGVVSFAMIAE
jgi:6-phosphogluconolactonase (cycloisomerase 2 family)